LVEQDEVAREEHEPDYGPDDAQEADHPEVLEEEGLAETVAGGEDDGRQDECEEELVGEVDGLLEDLNGTGGTYLAMMEVMMPMMIAMLDSCHGNTSRARPIGVGGSPNADRGCSVRCWWSARGAHFDTTSGAAKRTTAFTLANNPGERKLLLRWRERYSCWPGP